MAFCTCMRFSAWSNTIDRGESITSSVTSAPRCAGRQCRKTASGAACAIRSVVHLIRRENVSRASASLSWPMLVQTSV